jgi:hypothetical protein
MDQKSQLKVLEKGFSIYRKDDSRKPRIKLKSIINPEWHFTKMEFKSKDERDRKFDELMNYAFNIED